MKRWPTASPQLLFEPHDVPSSPSPVVTHRGLPVNRPSSRSCILCSSLLTLSYPLQPGAEFASPQGPHRPLPSYARLSPSPPPRSSKVRRCIVASCRWFLYDVHHRILQWCSLEPSRSTKSYGSPDARYSFQSFPTLTNYQSISTKPCDLLEYFQLQSSLR